MTAPKQSETSDDRELVERLRWIHDHNLASFAGNAACSAADRIEALSAALAQSKREADQISVLHNLELDRAQAAEAALADANTRIGEFGQIAGRVLRLAEQRCPCRDDGPDPCPLCDARVDAYGDEGVCKADKYTLPRDLIDGLRRARAALTPATEKEPGR